jgi:hypothetical protein
VIGSIRTGKFDYDRDEHFWGPESVPHKARDAVRKAKGLTDPDVLELKKKEWNLSNQLSRNPSVDEPFERKLIRVRMGLLDQPHVKMSLPRLHIGCDTRNEYTGWNVSVQQDFRKREKDLALL